MLWCKYLILEGCDSKSYSLSKLLYTYNKSLNELNIALLFVSNKNVIDKNQNIIFTTLLYYISIYYLPLYYCSMIM